MFIGKRRYVTTSITPQVFTKHTAEGTIIPSVGIMSRPFRIIFSLFTAAFLIQISAMSTRGILHTQNIIVVALISGIITLGFVVLVGNMLRLGPASITVQGWPLSLNQPTRLRFHRRAYFGNVGPIYATLYCAEKTVYHNTKHGKTRHIRIWESQLPVITMPEDASSASAEWQIIIPPDLPPSFHTEANAIEWVLEVEVGNGLLGGAQSTFLLHVQPVCAIA